MDDMLELGDGMVPDIPRESIIKMRDEYSKSFHQQSNQVKQIQRNKEAAPDKNEENEDEMYPALEIISGKSQD